MKPVELSYFHSSNKALITDDFTIFIAGCDQDHTEVFFNADIEYKHEKTSDGSYELRLIVRRLSDPKTTGFTFDMSALRRETTLSANGKMFTIRLDEIIKLKTGGYFPKFTIEEKE